MNRHLALPLVALGLCVAAGASFAETYPKTTFSVVGNIGITTQSKELEQPFWTKVLPEASGGAISATIKPWNEMGLKGNEVMKLLRQGLFDVGTTQLGFLAGDAPINDATDLAGVSTTLDIFRQVTMKFRPYLERYYEKELGLKILSLQSFQAQVLYCRDEIKGLSSLKGRKVRVSGASQADFVGYFGGSGINMAFGEVQQGLQSGVIDCAITGTLGGYKAKWSEGAKYLYPLAINWGSSVTAMNMAAWNKLAPSVQKLLTTEMAKLEERIYEQNRRENDIGIACNTGSAACPEGAPAKMTLVPVSDGDLELRRKALEEAVLPRWGKRCGVQCTKDWNDSIGKVVNLTIKTN
jgi:TRAP-type C4-dicarboxylate transport system substrate-binding protein